MASQKRSQWEKFPRPRGWAMNWVFAQEIAAQMAEMDESGAGSRKRFAEPRGWAMKWDGSALAKAGEQQDSTVKPR